MDYQLIFLNTLNLIHISQNFNSQYYYTKFNVSVMSKLNKDSIINLFVISLIIADLFLLTLITFYELNPEVVNTIIYFDLFVCIILFCEFSYRIRKEEDKKKFIRANWTDIIAMIVDFLFLRVFRFVRVIRVIRLIRLARVLAMFKKELRHIFDFFQETHLDFAIGILLFVIFAGTLSFFILESGQNTEVQSLTDALWYSITTTIVGGGDIFPETLYGRIITVLLIIAGVTFIGMLTASIASWFVRKSDVETEKNIEKDLLEVKKSIDELKQDIGEIKEFLKKVIFIRLIILVV